MSAAFAPWPHQLRGVEEILRRRGEGHRRIVLQSPTGGGKTWCVEELVRRELAGGGKALLYTGRRMMLEQLQRDMTAAGIDFGVRAAGHLRENACPFQIGSLPTDRTRSKKTDYEDFPATLVVADEGHLCTGDGDQRVLGRHLGRGACVVYPTATPVGMGDVADVIVTAGTNSELRACGALVRARHYGPDEPALARFKTLGSLLDSSEEERAKAVMTPGIFGRVLEWFDKLNPGRKPTILFAPGVPESRWFAEQFMLRGITAAHVDGDEVVINGAAFASDARAREEVRRGSECGGITVICNRFVLREGVNYPWLAHGILACVFDSLQSYLQAGGRLLRAHPSLKSVCVQDHGSSWWRHGSLNEDRVWRLDLTARSLAGLREDGYRDPDAAPEAREPFRCPACAAIVRGPKCLECGHAFRAAERYRAVAQADGTLVRVVGKMFRPHAVRLEADTAAKWKKVYFRMRNTRRPKTFNQALAFFHHTHGYRPPKGLPLMPADPYDWYRPVGSVPRARLVPDPDYKPGAKPKAKTGAPRGTRATTQGGGLFDGVE